MLKSHKLLASLMAGEAKQKVLKLYQAGQPQDVAITLSAPEAQSQDGGEQNSSAEPSGWSVNMAYQASPDSVLYNGRFPSEDQATKIYEDIVREVAEVNGLIRSEKFEEAAAASKKLVERLGANSANQPVEIAK